MAKLISNFNEILLCFICKSYNVTVTAIDRAMACTLDQRSQFYPNGIDDRANDDAYFAVVKEALPNDVAKAFWSENVLGARAHNIFNKRRIESGCMRMDWSSMYEEDEQKIEQLRRDGLLETFVNENL